MTREELTAVMDWLDEMKDLGIEKSGVCQRNLKALASALREAWAEIDRLKAEIDHLNRLRTDLEYAVAHRYDAWKNPLDAALNENDGVYRP